MRNQKQQLLLLRIYLNTIGLIFKNTSARLLLKLFSTPRKRVIRKKEIEFLDTSIKSSFKYNGKTVCTYRWGKGKKKALLIHGWESNAGSLGAFVEPLLAADYQVVSFDAPAHGSSGGKQTDIFEIQDIMTQIIHQEKSIDTFIGHSLGAATILLLNKINSSAAIKMERCILISPFNRMIDVFKEFKAQIYIPNSIFTKMLQLMEKKYSFSIENINLEDISPKSTIKKAIILHDIADRIVPYKNAERIDKNWQNSILKPIKGSGHYRILWNAEALRITASFLKK